MVYLSVNKDEDTLKDYLTKSQLEDYLPVYYDKDRTTWTKYGLTKTPTTFILDEKGVILQRWTGLKDWNNISLKDLESFKN